MKRFLVQPFLHFFLHAHRHVCFFELNSTCSKIDNQTNEFEEVLANSGTIVLKFWLQIDRETQLERFESRMADPRKQWKITPEDWRNRERWVAYVDAAEEVLQKTSTSYAPWIVVEANDKYYSRIKVLKTVAETLARELKS